MKKYKLLLLTLISINTFALSGEINTGISFKTNISRNYDINKDYLKFESTNLNLNLYDLKLKINNNFDIFTKFRTQRKDITISDLDNSDIDKDKRENHDIMPKIGVNMNFDIYDKLKSKTSLTYYIDDFWNTRNKKNGLVYDEYKSVYIDGNEKEALGNIIINQKFNGSIKDVKFDFEAEYKANQLRRFNKDKSYFKIETSSSGKINDNLELSGKYNFNIDLNLMSKPFDPLKVDFDEFPDYLTGDYVTYYKQDGELKLDYTFSKNNTLISKFNFDHFAFYSRSNTYDSRYKTFYDAVDPSISLGIKSEVLNKENNTINLTNTLISEINYRNSIYKGQDGRNDRVEKSLALSPKISTNINHIYNKDSINSNLEVELLYSPKFLVLPYITTTSNMVHTIEENLNYNFKYTLSNTNKFELDMKNKFKEVLEYNEVPKINIDSNFDLKYENKINDKLEVKTLIQQKLIANTHKKMRLDKLSEKFKLQNTTIYSIFDNLKYENNFEFSNNSNFNYVLRTSSKPKDKESSKKYGVFVRTDMINSLSLGNKLVFDKKIKNVILKPGIAINLKLDFLNLRNEKLYNYTRDIENYKETPILDTELKSKTNIGGKIEIIPNFEIIYTPIEKLEIKSNIGLSTLFERKVINIIDNEDRPDNKFYGAIDKKFDFRAIIPNLDINLKYSW